MNVTTWLWLEWFQSLPITGKVAIVAGHILVLLLIMLDATSTSHRHTPSSIEPAEKFVHTVGACPEKVNLYNANKRGRHLLNLFCNKSLIKHLFYYQTANEGDNPTHDVWWHMGHIVNWRRRRVNQSGKEPRTGNGAPCSRLI